MTTRERRTPSPSPRSPMSRLSADFDRRSFLRIDSKCSAILRTAKYQSRRSPHRSASSPTIIWTAVDQVADCGQHTVVVSNSATDGEVDICYRNAALRPRLDELVGQVEILFGVANDGGGIAILPNGQIIHIPPWNPDNALFRKIADGLAEVGRGFAVAESVRDSPSPGVRKEINGARLKLKSSGLTHAVNAIDEVLSARTSA